MQLEILGDISRKVENIVSQVAGEHKDLHGSLSKIGKSIDRVSRRTYAITSYLITVRGCIFLSVFIDLFT